MWSSDSCSAYTRSCLKSAEVNWHICGKILRINFLSFSFNLIFLHSPVYVHWRQLTLVNEFKCTIFEMHETSWQEIKSSLIVENFLISFHNKVTVFLAWYQIIFFSCLWWFKWRRKIVETIIIIESLQFCNSTNNSLFHNFFNYKWNICERIFS